MLRPVETLKISEKYVFHVPIDFFTVSEVDVAEVMKHFFSFFFQFKIDLISSTRTQNKNKIDDDQFFSVIIGPSLLLRDDREHF